MSVEAIVSSVDGGAFDRELRRRAVPVEASRVPRLHLDSDAPVNEVLAMSFVCAAREKKEKADAQ